MATKRAKTAKDPFTPTAAEIAAAIPSVLPSEAPAKPKRTSKPTAVGKPIPEAAIAPKAGKKGRPATFREEYIELAHRLTLLKADFKIEDMAKVFQVAPSTFSKWLVDHPLFSEAIARAKTPSDSEVANSLKKRALGYEYYEEQAIKIKKDGIECIEIVRVKKHLPPDFNSMSLWLRNRNGDAWKSNPEPNGELVAPVGKISVTIQKPPETAANVSDAVISSTKV